MVFHFSQSMWVPRHLCSSTTSTTCPMIRPCGCPFPSDVSQHLFSRTHIQKQTTQQNRLLLPSLPHQIQTLQNHLRIFVWLGKCIPIQTFSVSVASFDQCPNNKKCHLMSLNYFWGSGICMDLALVTGLISVVSTGSVNI